MKVIEYLNWNSLEELKEEYAIKVSINEKYPNLMVLCYNQIESPKSHPIVIECRSLVVEFKDGKYQVVSRAFDRFFNQGECGEVYELSLLSLYEKVDGSLISVFYYNGEWLYRTKSMIMPECEITPYGRTWKMLIESALDWENIKFDDLNKNNTYIFEVVGEENRVVVKYNKDDSYLLAVRDNITGQYVEAQPNAFKTPREYKFDTTEECLESLKSLPNLEEGYVGYVIGAPVVKVKSPQYLAAHRLRGEGLTPKRIMEMVIIGEYEEYFATFPDDKPHFTKYINEWNTLQDEIQKTYDKYKHIDSNKDFAIAIDEYYFKGVLFSARQQHLNTTKALNEKSFKYKQLLFENKMRTVYSDEA